MQDIADDTPLRLADAVKIAFPAGGMTISGLRRERDAGRLVVRRIAGKDFTTLADIRNMMEACRVVVPPKVAYSNSRDTGSAVRSSIALASALATIQEMKESLRSTSAKKTR